MTDVSTILTTEDYSQRRTPPELATWVTDICNRYSASKEAKEYARLRKGLAKQFFEEARPLSLLATHLFGSSTAVFCQPVLGNQAFDSVIEDHRQGGIVTNYLECTCAIDGYADHLRMKVLNQKGHVSAYGNVVAKGNKRTGHEIEIDGGAVSRDELRNRAIALLTKALKGKAERFYGASHWLCVEFDDWIWLRNDDDAVEIRDTLADFRAALALDFGRVFILGSSGKLVWDLR